MLPFIFYKNSRLKNRFSINTKLCADATIRTSLISKLSGLLKYLDLCFPLRLFCLDKAFLVCNILLIFCRFIFCFVTYLLTTLCWKVQKTRVKYVSFLYLFCMKTKLFFTHALLLRLVTGSPMQVVPFELLSKTLKNTLNKPKKNQQNLKKSLANPASQRALQVIKPSCLKRNKDWPKTK